MQKNSQSDHASLELAVSNSASNGLVDLKQGGKLKTMNMHQESLQNIGPTSRDSQTSEMLFPLPPSMSSAEVSLAKTFPLPEKGKDCPGRDQLFGAKCSDSFAKLGPDGSWLKTFQGFYQVMVDGSLETYSETWPSQGTMRNGECYLRPEWEPPILDDECLSWPTPASRDWKGANSVEHIQNGIKKGGHGHMGQLSNAMRMFPTPTSCDGSRGVNGDVKILAGGGQSQEVRKENPSLVGQVREDVPNTTEPRLQESGSSAIGKLQTEVEKGLDNRSSVGGWWSVEPGICRVAHGIPNRVDRLRCLGNAVVPQVAQKIGEMILEYEKEIR